VLHEFPVVILHGARQTGKTTLATMPEIGAGRTYLSMDDFDTIEIARRDPGALFTGRDRITIDEVQRQPDLLLAIKSEVDRNRKPGRFLLTGSANLLLMQRVSENLAGRAVYFQLPPLTWAETERKTFGSALDTILEKGTVEELIDSLDREPVEPKRTLPSAIFSGGYPVPSLSDDSMFRSRWFDGYIQTYLERDLRDMSATDNLIEFRRLMQMCAAQNGRLLNIAAIAHDAGLSLSTARRYIGFLEVSFQIARVPAFSVNRGKRVIKSPKVYWTDTGLAAHLAGIFSEESLTGGRKWGLWLENYVGIHLQVYASLHVPRITVYHWRTASGNEVDFVLEYGRKLIPIEVKTTTRPTGSDIKGLKSFLALYPEALYGVLACQCKKPTVLSKDIIALPIPTLLLS